MTLVLRVNETLWLPYNRIRTVTRFENTVTITHDLGTEQVYGEDAQRIIDQLDAMCGGKHSVSKQVPATSSF